MAKRKQHNIREETIIERVTNESLDQVQAVTETMQKEFDATVEPIRKNVFRRFPALFLILVTIGVVSTLLGLEQLLLRFEIFANQPLLLFTTGVCILIFTGTLYKKLG